MLCSIHDMIQHPFVASPCSSLHAPLSGLDASVPVRAALAPERPVLRPSARICVPLRQLHFPRSHLNHFRSIAHATRVRHDACLFQVTRKTCPRLLHNSTAQPVPPPHTASGGMRLLHVSVVTTWSCPPS
jgi:hypothetical protein